MRRGSKTASTTPDANGCVPVKTPAPSRKREARPTARLVPSKTYDVTLRTNCGTFTIRLATKTSPNATASFVSLARKGFFDDTIFHRIVPGFVIQGGDPTGTGAGGPGYSTVDRPPDRHAYPHGAVAMAKTQTEPPRHRRQPVLRRHRAHAQLPPDYAVLGHVVPGLAVVDRIGTFGDPASGNAGTPLEIVVIEKATIHVALRAVVLAAGASTRYGGPKQWELLPAVLAALATASSTRSSSSKARTRSSFAGVRVVRCPDWERGPGASLRCGLAALGDDVTRP